MRSRPGSRKAPKEYGAAAGEESSDEESSAEKLENTMLNVFRKVQRGSESDDNLDITPAPVNYGPCHPANLPPQNSVPSLSGSLKQTDNICNRRGNNSTLMSLSIKNLEVSTHKNVSGSSPVSPAKNHTAAATNTHVDSPVKSVDNQLQGEPGDGEDKMAAFRSAITHLLCGLYCMVIVVLGFVMPMSNSLTGGHRASDGFYYVEVFHLYIYVVSLMFLIYLHAYVLRHKGDADNNVNLLENNQLNAEKLNADYEGVNHIYRNMTPGTTQSQPAGMRDLEPAPVTYEAEGVNFYLRLGAIGFGLGSMIHDGFAISQVFESHTTMLQCYGPIFILVSTVRMVFIFFQTFFIFKSHQVVINMHKALVRFGLVHMIAANICIWLMATITETTQEYHGTVRKHEGRSHINPRGNVMQSTTPVVLDSANLTVMSYGGRYDCKRDDSLVSITAPYLYPCTVEYTLIAAAVIYKMFKHVGKVIITPDDLASSGSPGSGPPYKATNYTVDCHKANKGLFLGLLVLVITLISVSLFFVFDTDESRDLAGVIFYVTEIVLLLLSCIVVIACFFRFQSLKFVTYVEEEAFHQYLIITSVFFYDLLQAFVMVSSVALIDTYGLLSVLSLAGALLGFTQASLQVVFILDGLRRCAECDYQEKKKPGRALVIFLLLCNLSLWVVSTFEVRKGQTMPLFKDFFGDLSWGIIFHSCIPMIIFFRFHSTVCLSDIWENAYKLEKKRQ